MVGVYGEGKKRNLVTFEMDFKIFKISTRRDPRKTNLNNSYNMIIHNYTN